MKRMNKPRGSRRKRSRWQAGRVAAIRASRRPLATQIAEQAIEQVVADRLPSYARVLRETFAPDFQRSSDAAIIEAIRKER